MSMSMSGPPPPTVLTRESPPTGGDSSARTKQQQEKGWVRKLWPWLAKHKGDVFLAFGVAIVGMVIAALTPVVEKVLLDNITKPLGSGPLDAALTSEHWTDRALGRNENVRAPLVTVWYATGNNVQLVGDTHRRVCRVRLHSPLERPEERGDFRHGELRAHVLAHTIVHDGI